MKKRTTKREECSWRTSPEAMTPIRCSSAETLTDGCGCFRLRSSDVSESPRIWSNTNTNTDTQDGFTDQVEYFNPLNMKNRQHSEEHEMAPKIFSVKVPLTL